MPNEPMTVTIEDAQIIYRNFGGNETPFNQKGKRNFAVVLDQKTADMLSKDGWNVKTGKVREGEEDEPPILYIPVSVRFDIYPPKITMITSTSRFPLTENSVEVLDFADIKLVDLIFRSYEWTMPNGATGIKAYLKTMFVTINEDELERKYATHELDNQ